MIRNILIFTLIISSANAISDETPYPNFEAELRALETNQLKTEELQMRNADAVTDVIEDSVATGQAAISRATVNTMDILGNSETDVVVPAPMAPRVRRIRSR